MLFKLACMDFEYDIYALSFNDTDMSAGSASQLVYMSIQPITFARSVHVLLCKPLPKG